MRLEVSLQARQEMRLKLAPQIIQSIEILQLPLLELLERIDQELLENPLLEVVGSSEEPADDAEAGPPASSEEPADDGDPVETVLDTPETDQEPLRTEDYEALGEMLAYEDREPSGRSRLSNDEKDAKLAAIENSPAPDITLEEHLRRQLAMFDIAPDVRRICEYIVANLDWRGYFPSPLEEVAPSLEPPATVPQVEEALKVVQQLEPTGVGARDLNECLLLQLDPAAANCVLLRRLIQEHLDDIIKNRYPKVAKAVGCTMEELKQAIEEIGKLNPLPGALFGEQAAPHVMPDVRVELVEGEYRVILEDTALPSLRIASYYARRLQQKDLDPKTEAYLRDKLQSARWLMDAIQQRRSTLYNITSAIVEAQKEFLQKGPMHLKPLKMQGIADQVGVHVSTVSRALAGKYAQTPRGVLLLKHFFTGGVEKDDGEMESWEVVRQKLLQIIANEDKRKPMSDEEIAAGLGKQGIEIARRTVSKYRKVLSIASSRQRRQY
jgi:RNA polymerase sigma-54 factor